MRKKTTFIASFNLLPLFLLVGVCFFRMFFFVEFPWTVVLPSTTWYPPLQDALVAPLFSMFGVSISASSLLVFIWILGFAHFVRNYIKDAIALHKYTTSLHTVTDLHTLEIVQAVLEASGRTAPVRLVQSFDIHVPMISGFFHPTIFLPMISFTDEELFNILCHEWAHHRHKDAWFKLFSYLVCSVFWWNPFIYLLKADLNHILEIKCDLSVSSSMSESEKLAYLTSIKKVLQHKLTTKKIQQNKEFIVTSPLVSLNSMSKVEQRFLLVLDHNPKGHRRLSVLPVYGLILSLLLFSYTFVVQPASPAPTEEDGYELFSISPDNAYLVKNIEGGYDLFADGECKFHIENIDEPPFADLPIYNTK